MAIDLQHRYVRLFENDVENKDVVEQFLLVDLSCLRSFKLTKRIPPPGTPGTPGLPGTIGTPTLPPPNFEGFRCTMLDRDGKCRNTLWGTKHKLMVHSRFSHGLVHILKSLVITNQCLWCLSTFRTVDTAKQHVVGHHNWECIRSNCALWLQDGPSSPYGKDVKPTDTPPRLLVVSKSLL